MKIVYKADNGTEFDTAEQCSRYEEQIASMNALHEKILTGLTKEMVDLIAPDHNRTSCSDSNNRNGFSISQVYPRCIRCGLLEIVNDRYFPEHLILEVSFKKIQ